MALATGQAMDIGAIEAPAAVGEPPRTPCTNRGTKVRIPIIVAPMKAPVREATAMNRWRKSPRGMTGSGARASTARKAARATAAAGKAMRAAFPPCEPARRPSDAAVSRAAPAKSRRWGDRTTFSWKNARRRAIEASPNGMLM